MLCGEKIADDAAMADEYCNAHRRTAGVVCCAEITAWSGLRLRETNESSKLFAPSLYTIHNNAADFSPQALSQHLHGIKLNLNKGFLTDRHRVDGCSLKKPPELTEVPRVLISLENS